MSTLTKWVPRLTWGTKAAVAAPISAAQGPHPYSLFLNASEITPTQAWYLYANSAVLAKIVDLIADNVAALAPIVKVDDEAMPDHPIIAFMKKPGFNRTRRRFIKEIAVQYLVTGTAYVQVYGNPALPPIALDVLKSRYVTSFQRADAWPDSFLYAEMTRTINFTRDDDLRDPRYLDAQSGFSELLSIYDIDGSRRGIGMSRLNAIRAEVELRVKGLEHNSSVMDKGARTSGVLSFKSPLDEEQRGAIREEVQAYMTGGANAGRVLVLGNESSWTPTSQNAKDMDFVKLMQSVEDAIVARYNIPITLYRTEAQTDNNYETAWNVLYDQAVLPCFETIYSALAAMFSERLGVEVVIEHDKLTNPILARQAAARAMELHNAQLVSKNEARDMIGMEPVLGGDTILGPMGMVPIAEDMFTTVDVALGRGELEARQARLTGGQGLNPARQIKPKPQEGQAPAKETAEGAKKSFDALGALLTELANKNTKPDTPEHEVIR